MFTPGNVALPNKSNQASGLFQRHTDSNRKVSGALQTQTALNN